MRGRYGAVRELVRLTCGTNWREVRAGGGSAGAAAAAGVRPGRSRAARLHTVPCLTSSSVPGYQNPDGGATLGNRYANASNAVAMSASPQNRW